MANLAVDQRILVVGHALHEIAVVRDQKQRAGPSVEQVFHLREHVGVQIVARLVQDEHIRLVEQDEHQRKASLLPARQVAHWLVQVIAGEAEALEQLRGRGLLAVKHHAARIAANDLAHAVASQFYQVIEVLRQDRELHGLADLHAARARGERALDHPQKRGLARTVLADNAEAVAGADDPRHVVEHGLSTEAHRHIGQIDHLLAQARDGHPLELERVAQWRHVGNQLAGSVDAELRLGRARLRPASKPGELAAQLVLSALLGHLRLTVALDTLLDIGGETTLERVNRAVVHFPHRKAHLVEEPAVVRDHQKRARPMFPACLQMMCEPGDGAHVEMVGGLVEHEHVPVADEQAGQVNAAALSARQVAYAPLPGDIGSKPGDDIADAGISCPLVFGGIAHHGMFHRIVVGKRIRLPEHTHANAARANHAALIRLDNACKQREQRGFPVAVLADDADAVALVKPEGDILEHRFRGELDPRLLTTKQKRHTIRPSFTRHHTGHPAAFNLHAASSAVRFFIMRGYRKRARFPNGEGARVRRPRTKFPCVSAATTRYFLR